MVQRFSLKRRCRIIFCHTSSLWSAEALPVHTFTGSWSPPPVLVNNFDLCDACQCSAVQCSAVQCSAVQCSACGVTHLASYSMYHQPRVCPRRERQGHNRADRAHADLGRQSPRAAWPSCTPFTPFFSFFFLSGQLRCLVLSGSLARRSSLLHHRLRHSCARRWLAAARLPGLAGPRSSLGWPPPPPPPSPASLPVSPLKAPLAWLSERRGLTPLASRR